MGSASSLPTTVSCRSCAAKPVTYIGRALALAVEVPEDDAPPVQHGYRGSDSRRRRARRKVPLVLVIHGSLSRAPSNPGDRLVRYVLQSAILTRRQVRGRAKN